MAMIETEIERVRVIYLPTAVLHSSNLKHNSTCIEKVVTTTYIFLPKKQTQTQAQIQWYAGMSNEIATLMESTRQGTTHSSLPGYFFYYI